MKIATIKELNEKMWYRLIKVSYLIFFAIIITISILIFINSVKESLIINEEKSKIVCDNNQIEIFYNELDLDSQSQHGYIPYDKIEGIKNSCYLFTTQEERYSAIQLREKISQHTTLTDDEKNRLKILIMQKNNLPSYIANNYNEVIVYATLFKQPLGRFISWFLIGGLLIFGSFEIIKRGFYYIVTGKINPPKI